MSKKEILVIEDNAEVRDAVSDALRGGGYSVHAVQDGYDALLYLRNTHNAPKLILVDMVMPTMDGPEFLRHLAQEFPRLISESMIVVASSRAGLAGSNTVQGLQYLNKPFSIEQLLEIARRAFYV